MRDNFLSNLQASNKAELERSVYDSPFMREYMAQRAKNSSAPVVGGSTPSSGAGSSWNGTIDIPAGKGVLPVKGRFTQKWHNPNKRYAAGHHTGVDWVAPEGSKIGAAKGGVVTFSGWDNSYGNYVKIRHKDGTTSLYAHMVKPGVKAGTKVNAGSTIGFVGNTGKSDANHLHFEVRKTDRYGADIDPISWLRN